MESSQIKNWVVEQQPALDEPEVYIPDTNQVLTDKDWREDATKCCLITPVPFSSAIANMGVAILYDIINNDMSSDYLCTRAYFPESKMYRRMKKNDIPFFDKECFHQMLDYDVIGFASFYSLQYLGLPDILQLSNIPYETDKRGDDFSYPLVILGGCQSFNAEPVAPLLDAIIVGEGENSLPAFLKLLREYKQQGGTSRKEFLAKAAKEIQGVYVPSFLEYTYYPSDHPTKPNQIKEFHLTEYAEQHGVPLITTKSYNDFKNQKILTKTFVGNSDGAEMSVGSVFIATSCGSRCSFCQGSAISQPYRERPLDKIKQATIDLIKSTGTAEITPYSFNLSDFSYVNTYIKYLMKDLGVKVSMS